MTLLGRSILLAGLLASAAACSAAPDATNPEDNQTDDLASKQPARVIVFVWDGLRPDVINAKDTPNLAAMKKDGSYFSDNHATYPTFTMMNASSFATGSFPATVGFYGNTLWQPGAMGNDANAKPVDFNQPAFTEDYSILSALDAYYNGELLMVGTLFEAAQAAGLTTVAVGKSGPAFLQDRHRGGVILDEKMAFPLTFAQELQAAKIPLPKLTPNAYEAGAVMLDPANGDPTAQTPKKLLADGSTSDPTDASGAPPRAANQYMMGVYLDYILPVKKPDLSVVWLRNPDATQHTYGVGTPNSKDALHAQDELLGQLQAKLVALGLDKTTDVIVVSDHGHSNVSGNTKLFPLRGVANGAVTGVDPKNGYSVSGDVRLADLLTRAGFTAFDGSGCAFDPVLSGMKADGTPVYPLQTDSDGHVCGMAGKKYNTPSYVVPSSLPANALVIAANGGSDYVYCPSHDEATIKNVVRFLQSRKEYGAVFVASRYGDLPGTMPLDVVNLANASDRNPDIVASFAFDADQEIQGVKGTEYESALNSRGMHGSFSPFDVHNTLVASGRHFRKHFVDVLPTGNVDVAPTIAALLKIQLPEAEGRVLSEAVKYSGTTMDDYDVSDITFVPYKDAKGLKVSGPLDPDGKDIDPSLHTYSIELHTKVLHAPDLDYGYFDYAVGVRK